MKTGWAVPAFFGPAACHPARNLIACLMRKKEKKREIMPGLAAQSLTKNTFGVSYTGNIPWGGMENISATLTATRGEGKRFGSISVEVFTIGEYFSLCVMQPGKNPALVEALIRAMAEAGVPCRIASEEHYCMPDCEMP